MSTDRLAISREQLLHELYEAAELEHNLMCTYLYAAFSLRSGVDEGLSPEEASAVARWRQTMLHVAIDEMAHLTAVWNITAALGGSPRFGRGNFPLDPGNLPASVVVRLAPFGEEVLQHFIHLERPQHSSEPDGKGFASPLSYSRGSPHQRITPMVIDYDTVGAFYQCLGDGLRGFVERIGEERAFCGDPALQLSRAEVDLPGIAPVICLKTALAAFKAIIEQGEGAPADAVGSHYQRFAAIRDELALLKADNPAFQPAFPAAVNPVLRRPLQPQGRIWIEDEQAAATVDLANAGYALMLRLMAYSYVVARPLPEKRLVLDLALGLMRAVTPLGEHAVRLPAGPSHPGCHAGMSFTALRDAAPLLPGSSALRFFVERLDELNEGAQQLARGGQARTVSAARQLEALVRRAARGVEARAAVPAAPPSVQPVAAAGSVAPPVPTRIGDVDYIGGKGLTLVYEGKKCIHARFCVTGAPKVFLANVPGPWIHPDAMEVDRLVEIAHACPSGAIRYQRKDGHEDEPLPPVNLIGIRESGPYAMRGQLVLDGEPICNRATLCRCGASKNKPFCDGSHHEVAFSATGEPATGTADMLPVRDGPLEIDPQLDGPLQVRGNMEIISGTGRVVSRVTSARLCRCGASGSKPFCDGSHARVGFKS